MHRLPTDDADCARLGRVVRQFREARALTQERLAEAAHVTKNYVADIEAGTRNPTYVVLGRLVRALSLTWEEFGAALDRLRLTAPRRRPPAP